MIQLYLRFQVVLVHFYSWIPCFLCSAILVLIPSSAFFFFFQCMFFSSTSFAASLFSLLPRMGRILPLLHCFLVSFPTALSSCFLNCKFSEILCSPHVLSVAKPCSLVFKCFCSKYTVGVLLSLHLYSSMRVCCCNFFASQSCDLLQEAYCFSLTDKQTHPQKWKGKHREVKCPAVYLRLVSN